MSFLVWNDQQEAEDSLVGVNTAYGCPYEAGNGYRMDGWDNVVFSNDETQWGFYKPEERLGMEMVDLMAVLVPGYIEYEEKPAEFIPPSEFSPIDLSGSRLWLDADDATTVLEEDFANNVSRWNDKSGEGYNVDQSIGGDQPATGVTTLNGRNLITFDGVTKFLQRVGDDLITGDTMTVFIVGQRISHVYNSVGKLSMWETGQASDSDNGASIAFEDGAVVNSRLQFSRAGIANETAHPPDGTPFIYTSIFDGAQNTSFLDGDVAGYANPTPISGNFNIQNILIGARHQSNGTANFWHGHIGEIIIYNRALPTSEREEVENYLSVRWVIPLVIEHDGGGIIGG